MSITKNSVITLNISSISGDGNGVGRSENQVIFVPHTAAGDVVRTKIVKAHKSYAFGRIEEILSRGEGRCEDACAAGGLCGGCCFGHLEYSAELAAKQSFVTDALRRIGGFDTEALHILPVIASPSRTRYRNKVQFPAGTDQNGRLTLGLYACRSHRIIPCEDCLLQPSLLNEIAARAAQFLHQSGACAYDENTKKGLVRHIFVREGAHTGEVLLCVVINGKKISGEDAFVRGMCTEFPQLKAIVLNTNTQNTNVILGKTCRVLFGDGSINSRLAGVPAKLDVFSFAQVNTDAAEGLFAVVRNFAEPDAHTDILDLYCGTGVIGLSMAQEARSLTGVEAVPQAVSAAEHSAAQMGLSSARFLCMDAAAAAQKLQSEGMRPHVAIVDPPRKGMDAETLSPLVAMSPKKIVMVSCNPATLARDLAALAQSGYEVKKVQPVDLFPRTRHVECVVLLSQAEKREL